MSATAVETITIAIDGAPAKEMLGLGNRHWRWEHYTRVNWTARVSRAFDEAELEPRSGQTYHLTSLHVDWGKKRPMLDIVGVRALWREVARAVLSCGWDLDEDMLCQITQAHSGVGRGQTRITLELIDGHGTAETS